MTISEDVLDLNTEGKIKTFTGIYFPLLDPDPSLIHVADIAHSLSRQCRYNGHWIDFCSVAGHSIEVSRRIRHAGGDVVEQLWGLLHDASEAYCGDLVHPLKRCGRLDAYIEIEDRVQQAVGVAFDLPWPMPEIVDVIDREVGIWEREMRRESLHNIYGDTTEGCDRIAARFLRTFHDLQALRAA